MRLGAESIFSSSIRSFCVAFFAILGICLSLMLFFLFLGGIFGSSKRGLPFEYRYEVLPNADFKRETLVFNAPVILQVDIKGTIGMESLTGESIENLLIESQEGLLPGNQIKAVLLSIDTPGGIVFDIASIYRVIVDYKKHFNVPVYAYIDGLCASGGVYVACAADKIYASNTSVIGSVGVLSEFFNVSDLLGKIGVQNMTLAEGKGKAAMNPFQPWKAGDEKEFVELNQFFYNNFLDIVATNRPQLKKEDLIDVYGAKLFPSPVALEHGYIDVADATRSQVLKDLAKAANIADDESVQVLRLAEEKWLGALFQAKAPTQITHHLEVGGIDTRLANQFLYYYKP